MILFAFDIIWIHSISFDVAHIRGLEMAGTGIFDSIAEAVLEFSQSFHVASICQPMCVPCSLVFSANGAFDFAS